MAAPGPDAAALGARARSRWCRPRCTSTASRWPRSGRRFLGSVALQALVVYYYYTVGARAAHPAPALRVLPDGPALHRWCRRCPSPSTAGACARACSSSTSRQVGPPPRERAGLQPGRRRAHGPAVPLRRGGVDVARGRGRRSRRTCRTDGGPRPPRLRQVRRRGVEHPRRLAAVLLVVPPLRPARFERRPGRPQAAGAGVTRCSPTQGIPVHHLGRGQFDPRIATDLVAPGPRGAARASCTSTATPPPTSAASPRAVSGAALVLHEHFADPRMPAYQGLADRVLAPLHRPRDRGQRLHPRLPGARAPRAGGEGARSSGTARPSTSSRRRRPRRRARVRRRAGHPRGRAGGRHHRPAQRAEGATTSCSRPRARVLPVAARRAGS